MAFTVVAEKTLVIVVESMILTKLLDVLSLSDSCLNPDPERPFVSFDDFGA